MPSGLGGEMSHKRHLCPSSESTRNSRVPALRPVLMPVPRADPKHHHLVEELLPMLGQGRVEWM